MPRKSLLSILLLVGAFVAVPRAAADAGVSGRYAAIVYAAAAEEEPATTTVALKNVGYLLRDPMAANCALEQADLADGAKAALDGLAAKLQETEPDAEIAFFYLTSSALKEFDAAGTVPADYMEGLPGKTKVAILDHSSSGPSDAKPALAVVVSVKEGATPLVQFDFTGPAGGEATVAGIVFGALRGGADKSRDGAVTLAELASFLAEKSSGTSAYELGELAETPIMKFRSPAEVVKSLGADASLALAGEYDAEERWVEALLTLRELKDTKITDPDYRKFSETAQLNLALESRYSPSYRKENVERNVENGLDLVSDELLLANVHYITDVDNRALFAGGVRNLQLLLDNSRLRAQLTTPENAKKAGAFKSFLDETVKHVYEKGTLPDGDFVMRVRRVLLEDDATVKLPPGVVVTEFVYGIPAALDPNTDFIALRQYKEFEDDTKGHFGGVGVELTLEDRILTIVTALDGTPAAEAGLLPGDRIVTIDGTSSEGMDLSDAVARLRGPMGTTVKIGIVHRGEAVPVEVSIKRGNITIESVMGFEVGPESGQWKYFVDDKDKIAYVRISDFKEYTPDDLDKVVSQLVSGGMKALVLDLRFNHGGVLKSSVRVSNTFLSEGTIVTVRGEHVPPQAYKARYFKTIVTVPVVVLVNQQSASAAEIVAAALQENKRATLVGTRTFGKGTVQQIFEVERGQSALKLTIEKYYTPNGESIHREPYSEKGGLTPDVEVAMSDEEEGRLYEVWHLRALRKDARERLVKRDEEQAARNPSFKAVDPDKFRDPQLDKALDILRKELAGEGTAVTAERKS